MKVLILATPRSGSSALNRAVTTAYGMGGLTEPFNYELHRNWDGDRDNAHMYKPNHTPFDVPDNYVIKALAFFNHWPDPYFKHWEKGMDHFLKVYYSAQYQRDRNEFFKKYVTVFDRTFLLLRRDVGAQLRSMLVGLQRDRHEGGRVQSHWWGKYNSFDPVLDEEGTLNARLLFESIQLIRALGATHKIPLVFYEDLYADEATFNATNARLELGLDGMWQDHFNPENKWSK